MLKLIIVNNIFAKELTTEEFREKTHYYDDKKVVTELIFEAKKDWGVEEKQVLIQRILDKHEGIFRAFGLFAEKNYIGYISFANYDSTTPELQIEIVQEYRNQGIGYKALCLLIAQIFKERKDVPFFYTAYATIIYQTSSWLKSLAVN